jgi:hypothetical protein
MSKERRIERTEQCHIESTEVDLFALPCPPSFAETMENYRLARDAIRPLEEKWADLFDTPEASEDGQ